MSGKLWVADSNKDVLCAAFSCVIQDEMFDTSEQEAKSQKNICSLNSQQKRAHQVILESVTDNGDG